MYKNGTVVRIQGCGLEGRTGIVRGIATNQASVILYIIEVGVHNGDGYDCVVIPGCCLYELPV